MTLPSILLAGNPNAGKTTLFNILAGRSARVGNYPGVTVERAEADFELPGGTKVRLVDLPGTYSLAARSPEEQVASNSILAWDQPSPSAVVVVADATALGRGLYFALQVRETGWPVVVALNMMDEAKRDGVCIDVEGLKRELGVEVVPLVASKKEGIDELLQAVQRSLVTKVTPHQSRADSEPIAPAIDSGLKELISVAPSAVREHPVRLQTAWAKWAAVSIGDDELIGIPDAVRTVVAKLQEPEDGAFAKEIIVGRYQEVDRILEATVTEEGTGQERAPSRTDRIDSFLTHPVSGLIVFALVMLVVFESLFAWADPAIELIEDAVAALQGWLVLALPGGAIRDLLVDGVVAGVGNVVVFVPQIALLFLFIGILEDSGYLARVAFVLDRVMGGVGLHGKAFVPMLSGFACAIPAVMATRTIKSRRDRLITMMVVPLTSCSARLPVYVLITAVVFSATDPLIGPLSIGAVVLFSMYALSIVAALGSAAVLRRTVLKGPRPVLVLELPPYRMPLLRNLLINVWQKVKAFLVEAGTVILAITIILWGLLAYPHDDAAEARLERERQAVTAQGLAPDMLEERLSELDAAEAGEQLAHSFAGRIGKGMEPILEPIGQDWRIGVGILGAFAAREVFVGTLAIVFGMEDPGDEIQPLRARLMEAKWPDGSPLFTPLSGIALLVFFVLAAQCMSTVAVVKRESGGYRWPAFMVAYMTTLAYGGALLVFQVGTLLGWGTG